MTKNWKNDSFWLEKDEISDITESSQVIRQNKALDVNYLKKLVSRSVKVIRGQKFRKNCQNIQILKVSTCPLQETCNLTLFGVSHVSRVEFHEFWVSPNYSLQQEL